MIKPFFRFVHRQKELYDLTALSNDYNLKRVVYTAVIVLVYQIVNITDASCKANPIAASVTALSLICISYAAVILLRYHKLLAAGLAMQITLSFWILLLFGLTQYFLSDIHAVGMPINVLTFCGLLVIVPIFTTRQSFGIFTVFLVFNLVLSVWAGASVHYIKYAALICISGFVISALIQQQYVRTILVLLQENRVDALTGIHNRRSGLDKIETLLALCKRHGRLLALYMIDVDFFKVFNDAYGHLEGDRTLRRVARAMEEAFGRRADIICRYGGEEFLACCSIHKLSDAPLMAERLLKAVADMGIVTPCHHVAEHLTVSVGYTLFIPSQNNTGDDKNHYALILEADQALYSAKEKGRNCAVLFRSPDAVPE